MCVLVVVLLLSAPLAAAPKGGGKGGGTPNPAIAYASAGTFRLYVMDEDGSNKAMIFDEFHVEWPSWSPDGAHIAFTNRPPATRTLWRIDIAVVDGIVQGSNPVQLVSDCDPICLPAWSPAGDVIAYMTGNKYYTPSVIWTIPADGGTPTPLYTSTEGIVGFSWNSDGTEMAIFEAKTAWPGPPEGDYEINILTVATGEVQTVWETWDLVGLSSGRGFDWSHDGATFALVVDFDLYTIDRASGALEFLVSDGMYPAFSPDTRLAYVEGLQRVKSIDLDTGRVQRLAGSGWTPDWKW